MVQVVRCGGRSSGAKFRVIVGESLAVLGKFPVRCEQHATIFSAHDLPAVRSFSGDGQHGSVGSALIGTINGDLLGAPAKIKSVLLAAEALNLHDVDYFAFGRVQLPVADERVGRSPQCTDHQDREEKG